MPHFVTKTAELGGAGNSSTYEQAFANLAHGHVRDVAPKLLDYSLGFQLIDRDDEERRAFGAMVAKIGDTTVVVPAFQLRGKMKGHEMMYLPEADKYLPLSEGWLNYLISRKPVRLGESTGTRDMFSQRGMTTPNLSPLSESPLKLAAQKIAQVYAYYAQPAAAAIAAQEFEQAMAAVSFPRLLSHGSRKHAEWVLDTMQRFPAVASRLLEYHGLDALSSAVKTAAARTLEAPARPAPVKQAELQVEVVTQHTYRISDKPLLLDTEEERELREVGRTIVDRRGEPETKLPIRIEGSTRLKTPERTGVYEVMLRPGELVRCLVLVGGLSGARASSLATVIRLDNKEWCNAALGSVWVMDVTPDDGDVTTFADVLADASPITSLPDSRSDSTYVVLSPDGRATMPFEISKSVGSARQRVLTAVVYADLPSAARPNPSNAIAERRRSTEKSLVLEHERHDVMQLVIATEAGATGRMVPAADQIYLTDECRVMKLAPNDWNQSENPPLLYGSYAEIEWQLSHKTAALRAWQSGGVYMFDVDGTRRDGLDRFDAVVALMQDAGLRRKHAEAVLSNVDLYSRRSQVFECRLKSASTGTDLHPQDAGPDILNFQRGPVQTNTTTMTQIPGHSAADYPQPSPSDPMDGGLSAARSALQQAASSGQKELFDLGAFESLVRTSRPDNLFDAALPSLMAAMDATGRQLMQLYSHQQEFAERYGKRDIVELEDSLRSLLEQLGTVTLFLKRRSGPGPEPGSDMSIDLSVSDAV